MQTNIPGGTVSFSLALAGGRESGKEGARVNNERNTSTRANETAYHLTPNIISPQPSSTFADHSFFNFIYMLPMSLYISLITPTKGCTSYTEIRLNGRDGKWKE